MLVRWCLDAVSTSSVSQFMVIWGVDVVSFGTENMSFGMLVAPTLTRWGPIGLFRGILEHKKSDVGIQAGISLDFGWPSGPHFESFWRTLEQHMCLFVMCVYRLRFSMTSGSEPGCLGSRIKHLVSRGVAKNSFSHLLGFC